MHRCYMYASLLFGFFTFIPSFKCYTYIQPLNTDNGYCETDGFGKIPVGEIGYDDKNCERGICSTGLLNGAGCGVIFAPPGCEVQKGSGHYPYCCPLPLCTENSSSNSSESSSSNTSESDSS